MGKQLAQDDIDSLVASALSKASDVPGGGEDTRGKEQATEPYNFSRAGQISNDQMKAIRTVNDLFARNLTNSLGAWLRSQFKVTLVSGEQMMYSEFLDRIPDLAYVCSARLEPLDAMAVIQTDLTLAPPIVDLLLGGVGTAGPLREPTEIEDQILMSVLQIVVRELNNAWQPVGLKFSLEGREKDSQVSRLMAGAENTLCISFEIRMAEVQGTINVCLPAVVLNTTLRRLIAEQNRPRRRSEEARNRLAQLMLGAHFGAVLQFPKMRLNAHDLAELVPGKLLRLPLTRNAAGELRVGGLGMFDAVPVRSGERRAAQIKTRSCEDLSSDPGLSGHA